VKPTHIILAGTSKAATTSVYNYLADHPEVCNSHIKQTNYFLEKSVQEKLGLYSTYQYSSNFKEYFNYFNCENKNHSYRLEATPDYMNYPLSIKRISEFSKKHKTRLVIILRHPVTRLKSWYNFGKQQGSIKSNETFEDYYNNSKSYIGNESPSLMAYKTGLYSVYLNEVFKRFEKDVVVKLFYENLITDSKNFMINLSKQLDLDGSHYNEYNFVHFNKTVKTKYKSLNNIYNLFRSFYIRFLNKGKLGVKAGQLLKSILSPLYKRVNTKKLENQEIDHQVINALEKDYLEDIEKIEQLIGKTPW